MAHESLVYSHELPNIITELPGEKSQAILAMDAKYVSPSYTRSYPFVIESGNGSIVKDVDGNSFLDLNAGIAVCSTGHCHPEVVKALKQQTDQFIHMSGTDFYYAVLAQLGKKLSDITPGSDTKKVHFGNSGAEAIETALKLARYHTGRTRFIAFLHSFHGRTMGALSLTSSKYKQRLGFNTLVAGVTHVHYPNPYRYPFMLNPGEDVGDHCIRYIEETIFGTIAPAKEVAAFIIEPIQGEGGYVVPPPNFLKKLKALGEQYGILLICDEVQSGMGRTGKMWAFEHFDCVPDIVCAAKGIASGMPLSAVIASEKIMNWEPGSHASTFGGNPLSCVAALKTIELLENGLIHHAQTLGDNVLKRLKTMESQYDTIGEVRGQGLMLGIEIVKSKSSKQPNPDLRDKIVEEAYRQGILILGCGTSTIRLSPPLVISQQQMDYSLDIIEKILKQYS